MPTTLPHQFPPKLRSSVTFTLRGAFTTGRGTVPHVLYLTEHYILTEFEQNHSVYTLKLGGRFAVDRDRRLLRTIDQAGHRAQSAHLKQVLGTIQVERSSGSCLVDGFECRLYTLRNENGRISVDAEAWCARVSGAEATALRQEREFDAGMQPFSLPLAPDEIVVRSTMRTAVNGSEHRQTYQLLSLQPRIDAIEDFDAFLDFDVVGN